MGNAERIKAFIDSVLAQLPPGLQTLNAELKQQLEQCLRHQLQKLSLVTREEFDVQTEVLARTRAKLDALEAKLRLWSEKNAK